MNFSSWVDSFVGARQVPAGPSEAAMGVKRTFDAALPQLARLLDTVQGHLDHNRDAEALAACGQLALLLGEVAADVGGAATEHKLAACYFDLGANYRMLRKKDEAERAYAAAARLWQKLAQACPGEPRYVGHLAACMNHVGLLYQDHDLLEQAEGFYLEARSVREKLMQSHPEDEENLVYLGGTLCNLGNVCGGRRELPAALDWYRQAIDILDKSIPGCDCGCRDVYARLSEQLTGRRGTVRTAQYFLRNALAGRAAVLEMQPSAQRHRHLRSMEQAGHTIVSILVERLTADQSASTPAEGVLQELRVELLDVVCFADGGVVFDVHVVKEIDAEGVALLKHLRGRLVGSGEWPVLCGLSDGVRAATQSVAWDEMFSCFATVEAAVADIES